MPRDRYYPLFEPLSFFQGPGPCLEIDSLRVENVVSETIGKIDVNITVLNLIPKRPTFTTT